MKSNMSEMERRSPFKARTFGRPGYERYIIEDNRDGQPRYFVGYEDEEWTEDIRAARLYANVDDLSHDLQFIQERELGHLGITRYTLTVDVTVLGKLTPEQVRQYLYDALTIDLDYRHYGIGPREDSVVMVKTDTASLRPVAGDGGGRR